MFPAMGNTGGGLKNKPVKQGSISGEDVYLKSQFKITDDQLKEYRSLFRDHSNDRKVITRKEFRSVYELIYKNGDPTEFADRVFDAFDTDKSGSVDFIEFAAGLTMMDSEMVEQKISIAFNMYDEDGSKTLSKQEVVNMIQVSNYLKKDLCKLACLHHLNNFHTSIRLNVKTSVCLCRIYRPLHKYSVLRVRQR